MSVLERSSVVVPTLGRPSLDVLLDALAAAPGPRPAELVLVDDLVPDPDWYQRLEQDLAALQADVAGSQGRVRVPLPDDRRPTDWERGTAGLATSSWITADLVYRRSALAAVGGFDERFPRAFREDSDLALRVMDTGARLVRG